MTRSLDYLLARKDDARVTEIRVAEAKAFNAPFERTKAKAAANLANWNRPRAIALA